MGFEPFEIEFPGKVSEVGEPARMMAARASVLDLRDVRLMPAEVSTGTGGGTVWGASL